MEASCPRNANPYFLFIKVAVCDTSQAARHFLEQGLGPEQMKKKNVRANMCSIGWTTV